MRTIVSKTLIAGILLSVLAVPALGQDSKGGLVAVLDVAKVFKNNARFDQQLARIRQEAETQKTKIQQDQESIRSRAEKVMAMPADETRYQQEARLEQEQAALRTRARQIEGDLLKREAKIYYDAYVEMQQIVAKMAKEYGITLVLRFDSSPIDGTQRGEVVKGVNRTVVYMHRLDLTDLVIKAMGTSTASVPTNQK